MMDFKEKMKKINFRKISMVAGSILLFIPTSVAAFWGNVSVYVASYFYLKSGSMSNLETAWVVSLCSVGVVLGLLVSGRITCFSQRWNLLIQIIISNVGYFICYFASLYLLAPVIYITMFICGVCIGIMDVVVFQHIADHSTTDKGLLVSIACSGISFGPFLVNPLTTLYVNADNLTPDAFAQGIRIFTQEKVVENVPTMFLVLGTASVACELLGFFLFIQIKPVEKGKCAPDEALTNESTVSYGTLAPECGTVACTENDIKSQNSGAHALENGENEDDSATPNGTVTDDTEQDRKPSELFRSGTFYVLCFCSGCQMFSNLISKNYYKTYGLLSINDDRFLSYLGAAMGIIGAVSLFIWGAVLDRINVKTSLIFLYVSFVMFNLLMYFTPLMDKWLYFISVNMLAATYNCKYPTYVTVCLTYFGSKYFSSNFGMLSAARMLVGFAAPPILDNLLIQFGWFSIFCFTATLSMLDLIFIILVIPRGKAK